MQYKIHMIVYNTQCTVYLKIAFVCMDDFCTVYLYCINASCVFIHGQSLNVQIKYVSVKLFVNNIVLYNVNILFIEIFIYSSNC